MNLGAICYDPVEIDREYPAINENFTFNSHGCNLITTLFIAQGAGPHPTILFLHGFPGNEKNHDLAQILRRAGCNVMVFHYRGSWGSEGTYSISNVLEDADTAVNFLKSEKCTKSYRVDPERIIIMGHSLGGFTSFMTAASHPEVKYVGFFAGFNFGSFGEKLAISSEPIEVLSEPWESSMPPLKGITPVQFTKEVIENRKEWNLLGKIEKLIDRKVLMVAGSRDDIAVMKEHHDVLVDEFKKCGAKNLREVVFDADHDFADKRIALAKEIIYWLDK